MTAALQFRDLTLGYDRHPAVHHLDGAIETGALVAVVGPNGAGKSTLFKGIVGLIKPLAGRMQTRAELYATIGYHEYEALDSTIAMSAIPNGPPE